MAYARRRYRRFRRRLRRRMYPRRRSGYRSSNRTMVIPRGPVARRAIVRMKYIQAFQIDPGLAGATAYRYFRCNGIHDPDYTGIGHQPLGHDIYETLYRHYTVLGSRCSVTFVPTDAAASPGTIVCGLRVDNNTTSASTDVTTLCEQPGTSYRVVTDSDNGGKITLSKNFSSKKFFGVTNLLARHGMGANFGSNPDSQAFFQAFCAPVDPLQDSGVVNCYVTLSYVVMLTEPLDLLQS